MLSKLAIPNNYFPALCVYGSQISLKHLDTNSIEVVRAKYVVGADGE